MIVLAVLAILLYLGVLGWFIYSADKDARSWVTPHDQFCHPYSKTTQLLLVPVLLGWMFPLFLLDLS